MVNGGGCSNEEGMRLVFDVARVVLGMQMNAERDRTQAASCCGIPRRISTATYGFRAEADGKKRPRNPSII